jgi:hypothetical protein
MNPDTPPLPYAHFDQWIKECWTTPSRYYVAEVMQDLWGTWVLKRSWGGLGNRKGSSKMIAAQDYDHAVLMLTEVAKHREARGYWRSGETAS